MSDASSAPLFGSDQTSLDYSPRRVLKLPQNSIHEGVAGHAETGSGKYRGGRRKGLAGQYKEVRLPFVPSNPLEISTYDNWVIRRLPHLYFTTERYGHMVLVERS